MTGKPTKRNVFRITILIIMILDISGKLKIKFSWRGRIFGQLFFFFLDDNIGTAEVLYKIKNFWKVQMDQIIHKFIEASITEQSTS